MAIALTGGPNIYQTFSGVSRSLLINNIASALTASGWAVTTITGGYQAIGTSPQPPNLTCTIKIIDPGSGSQITIQFIGSSSGYVHALETSTTYQIVAGPCQFFISQPGVNNSPPGTQVMGGVPFVPNVAGGRDAICGDAGTSSDPTTEIWWSMGDYVNEVFGSGNTPRIGLAFGGTVADEGCLNGVFTAGGGIGGATALASMFSTIDDQTILYANGSPLVVEPYVAWGDLTTSDIRVRGQLWDSMVVTEAFAMDVTITTFGTSSLDSTYQWINFTDEFAPGSLFLIKGSFGGGGGKRYVY